MASQTTLVGPPVKITRKSYTREFKLKVVKYYREPTNTLYATAKNFSVSKKCILRWSHDETKIIESSKSSKHCQYLTKGPFNDMEDVLKVEFLELRKKGLRVSAHWFKIRAKQLMEQMAPGTTFAWFTRFKARHTLSLRSPTNTSSQ